MKNILRNALHDTAPFTRGASDLFLGTVAHPAVFPLAAAGIATVSTFAFGTFLATETGRAILSELRRRARLRAPRPDSPSLRGAPTPEELAADAMECPRTLAVRLRIGSRLADLEPTLDTGNHYTTSPTGAKRIASRGRGFKGWLEDNRITVNYSTLMRHKRLAVRLRQLLALDIRLPLEWLLPGTSPSIPIPPDLRAQYSTARRSLAKLLREHRNFTRLSRHVDAALGIPQLLHARRTAAANHHRRQSRGKTAKAPPVLVAAAWCIDLEETLVENTKRELARFLAATGLPPKLETLRRHTLGWLNSL